MFHDDTLYKLTYLLTFLKTNLDFIYLFRLFYLFK